MLKQVFLIRTHPRFVTDQVITYWSKNENLDVRRQNAEEYVTMNEAEKALDHCIKHFPSLTFAVVSEFLKQ